MKRKTKRLPTSITVEEFKKLIKATKKQHHKLAFLLGFGSGLRVSEVVALEPRHIDTDRILIEQGKGNIDRVVPLPKGFKDFHKKLLPFKYKNAKAGIRSLQYAFKRTCNRAGLLKIKPRLSFHSLRHGFATKLLESGVPINQVQLLLGHANISTTSGYTRASPISALKSYEELF